MAHDSLSPRYSGGERGTGAAAVLKLPLSRERRSVKLLLAGGQFFEHLRNAPLPRFGLLGGLDPGDPFAAHGRRVSIPRRRGGLRRRERLRNVGGCNHRGRATRHLTSPALVGGPQPIA